MIADCVSRCILQVAGTVAMEARGGVPEAECALFEAGDIELQAGEPGSNREKGYRTTVAVARERLASAGITTTLTEEAARAMQPALARAYARGPTARSIVDRLMPGELFESRSYDGAAGRYVGAWLDLDGLARDLVLPHAGAILQALHLASLLSSSPDEEPVALVTGEEMALRPGERTLRRVDLSSARAVVDALRTLRPPPRGRPATEAGPGRAEIVAWLRDRAQKAPETRERMALMEAALSQREPPARGPLSETALWNLEVKLSRGETAGVLEQLDALEKRRGRAPGTTYLRARLALVTKTEEPRAIAERTSALSTSMAGFHELELLVAQAWLAAGDARRARAFARDLQENVSADAVLRAHALEVLEATGPASSTANVAVQEPGPAPAAAAPPSAGNPFIPRAPRAPSASDLEAAGSGASDPARARSSSAMRSLPPGTSFPPYRMEPRRERGLTPPAPENVEIERVETLSLPSGVQGEPPPADDPPRNPTAARLACTYLARELGRELRLRHNVDIQDDVAGLEMAQRYLREALVDGRVRTPDEEREVMRHGAFLSELVARRLGGRWVEVESRDAGTWAMLVPSRSNPDEVARVWPFGRVLRFVVMGHRERDLVSYYLELEARSR
jgi:hypothetical protein